MLEKRKLIVFDGSAWFVRRVVLVEYDIDRDQKIYRCDRHLGGPYKSLADIPMVKAAVKKRRTTPAKEAK